MTMRVLGWLVNPLLSSRGERKTVLEDHFAPLIQERPLQSTCVRFQRFLDGVKLKPCCHRELGLVRIAQLGIHPCAETGVPQERDAIV
jgi:hypothetical protein